MKKNEEILVGIALGMMLGISLSSWFDMSENYKQGQIDALTGNIKYELVTQPDSTWEEIK